MTQRKPQYPTQKSLWRQKASQWHSSSYSNGHCGFLALSILLLTALTGFGIPLLMMFGSQSGVFQPRLPFIPFAVLLGPYILLLSVQVLTEMLTWNWQSPVWLVTPIIYESYRVLQLMRGLKLGAELNAPAWMSHTIRGLVSCWVLILYANHEGCLVCWFYCTSPSTAVFYCFRCC
ncbi:Cytochrome P450 [Quillaja saponaria]|uniref:Cytochrome P450 n=1 Tax=Quillaja saponaria TaxID=32244 RepID=A0AAD7PNI6_QUISA|nr:Cytochrome P450 [Quillaja saponaria]